MRYLILRATIYYNEGSESKGVIHPYAKILDVESYRKELSNLVICNRIIMDYKEVEP